MAQQPAPAIRSRYDERYDGVQTVETIGSDTRFERGLGEIGTKVLLVDMEHCDTHDGCPWCGEHEMVLSLDKQPDTYDNALFYCTNIRCPHFVQDAVEHDMDTIRADKPVVWDNTAKCPECDTRFVTTLTRGVADRHEYVEGDAESGGIVGDVYCDDCTPNDPQEVDA